MYLKYPKIEIGNIVSQFFCEDKKLLSWIKEKYKGFLTSKKAEVKIKIFSLTQENKKNNNFRINIKNGKIFVTKGNSQGIIDLSLTYGDFFYLKNNYDFDSFLRILYSLLIVKNKGLLLHAASFLKENKGYLFCGKEETGKSTIIKITKEIYSPLTDEISLIKEKKGKYYIYSTPFWGELQEAQIKEKNVNKEIKAIYFLNKDKKNFVKPLTLKKALLKLVPNIVWFTKANKFTLQTFNHCIDLLSKVKSFDLHFLPDTSFLKYIF